MNSSEPAIVVGGTNDGSTAKIGKGKQMHLPRIAQREANLRPDQLTDASAINEAVGGVMLDRYRFETFRYTIDDEEIEVPMWVFDGVYNSDKIKGITLRQAVAEIFDRYGRGGKQ